MTPETRRSWVRALWQVLVPMLAITIAHYATSARYHWAHDLFRRLYYIPIVLAASVFGLRGALACSLLASALYVPHAFFGVMVHHDPGHTVEKLLEIVLYNAIAIITGTLVERERRQRRAQELAAQQLAASLDEQRTMTEQLVRAEKLRALGQMTAGLAHEIKNPLASIQGAAEILSDEVSATSPRRPMVEILHKELARLRTLLERFLSFARPQPFELIDTSVDQLIEPVVALLQTQATRAAVTIHWQRAGAQARVRADREQTAAVFMNVLLNAIQALDAGGQVWVRVETASRARHGYWCVVIEDDGPGVAPDIRDKIFDPFVTSKADGSGLGLAIAARAMDAQQGFIELGDRAGGGAQFRVFLPSAPATAFDEGAVDKA